MTIPIYLDTTLQKQLEPLAHNQGKGIGEIVNEILKNQIQLLTTLNPSKRPNSDKVAPRQETKISSRLKRTKRRSNKKHSRQSHPPS